MKKKDKKILRMIKKETPKNSPFRYLRMGKKREKDLDVFVSVLVDEMGVMSNTVDTDALRWLLKALCSYVVDVVSCSDWNLKSIEKLLFCGMPWKERSKSIEKLEDSALDVLLIYENNYEESRTAYFVYRELGFLNYWDILEYAYDKIKALDEKVISKKMKFYRKNGRKRRKSYEWPNNENKARFKTCVHESGHALIALLVGIPFQSVEVEIKEDTESVTGFRFGLLRFLKNYVHTIKTVEEYQNMVKMSYGGYFAEKIICPGNDRELFGSIHDIKEATRMASVLVRTLGFGHSYGLVNLDELGLSELTIARMIAKVCLELSQEAEKMLADNKEALLVLAKALYEKEKMTFDEVQMELEKFTAANEEKMKAEIIEGCKHSDM